MSTGAQRAEAQPEDGIADTSQQDWNVLLGPEDQVEADGGPDHRTAEWGGRGRIVGSMLMVLAAAWIGAAIWSLTQAAPSLSGALQWLSFLAPPLILLGLGWLIFGQTSRRETERFTRAVSAMRRESSALEAVLAVVATRLEENHTSLRGEAAKLMSLGDEASDRLGRVAHYLAKESANLDKKSEALESAAESARVDIGVLLQDLPKAEEQARGVAAAMKDAGLTAHGQAGALEGQLSALIARGREADEVVGGAAQRLGAHLARVESTASSATARLDESAATMNAVVDGTMARAAEAIDATRAGLDAQSAALFAAIEQNRAALQHAGDDAARNIKQRLDQVGEKMEALASHLAAQDLASHALLGSLNSELAGLDESFAELGRTGTGNAERLQESIATVRASVGGLSEELTGGQDRAVALIGRAEEMAQALGSVSAQLNGDVPAALARVEEQATRTHQVVSEIIPAVGTVEESSGKATASLAEAEASLARQQELLEHSGSALSTFLLERLGEVEAKMAVLRDTGATSAIEVGAVLEGLRTTVSELTQSIENNRDITQDLAVRAADVSTALSSIGTDLDERLPAALAHIEEQAARTRDVAAGISPEIEAVQASAAGATEQLAQAELSLARQREELELMLARLGEGVANAETQLQALGSAAEQADSSATRMVERTGPELIEALLRVRETAGQAAERAREAISAVIPQSAAALAEASRQALSGAISGPVEEQVRALGEVAEQAVETARRASERLTRQMIKIGETAGAVEARIEASREDREEKDAENFSRRVALLIESLNSTAIDVTKILSNEVTDSAWAAYLKGDRGVFTRRAVRLLDNAEARAIIGHYENEPEFREQVNRYIHDFEAMLRRILADRDSSALGVTILSSDMGKLYVALAQAIERLR